ncbi:hypothetical protein L3V86_01305 [Thiotrichales bacterium 19S11-10]|nr:hypothetical protein [Thiotrichales bacterium 19S11-10]
MSNSLENFCCPNPDCGHIIYKTKAHDDLTYQTDNKEHSLYCGRCGKMLITEKKLEQKLEHDRILQEKLAEYNEHDEKIQKEREHEKEHNLVQRRLLEEKIFFANALRYREEHENENSHEFSWHPKPTPEHEQHSH